MKNIFKKKPKLAMITTGIALIFIIFVNANNSPANQTKIESQRIQLHLRQVGHQFLSQSQDLHSLILPISQTDPNTYQINFQNAFSFVPDSLVKIVQTAVNRNLLPRHLMVNVKDLSKQTIVYGFEIDKNKESEVIPCLGRPQPTGHYQLEIGLIAFSPGILSINKPYLPLALISVCLVILHFISNSNGVKVFKSKDKVLFEKIGKMSFDRNNNLLQLKNQPIILTETESKLLTILIAKPNQLISRDFLLKEVWENDGVFTGRSLDVFLSRLRKKLAADPTLQITNVHGKGYMLKTNASRD